MCSSCILCCISVLSGLPLPFDKFGMYAIGLQKLVFLQADQLNKVSVNMTGVIAKAPCKSVCNLSPNTINATGIVFIP